MDSDGQTSARENVGGAGAFRKPSNDAANRKYRRRSPVGESSSDGSPARGRSLSPAPPTKDDSQRRKDDERDLGRDSGRSQHGRSGELHRYSERQSSRSTHTHRRHDEYTRHCRNDDNDERENLKSYSHHHRDSRGRDYPRDGDKYSRDKYGSSGHRSREKEKESSSLECQKYKEKGSSSDRVGSVKRYTNNGIEDGRSGERDRHKEYRDSRDEKTDHKKNLGEYKSDHSHAYKESRGHHNESPLKKDGSGHRLKEAALPDMELDGDMYTKEDKKKCDDGDRFKERQSQEKEKYEDRKFSSSRCQESSAKRSKFYSTDGGSTEHGKYDEKQFSNSKQSQVPPAEVTLEQGVKDSDIDAAKVAAMKAAELVNRNLIGTGYMTADQKKKLLWGSKKSTIDTEKPSHHWDTSTFGDRERQEKFNKLMGVKGGDAMAEPKPDIHDAEKQRELQMDLEKQYTAGLRRRDGRTVGLGL